MTCLLQCCHMHKQTVVITGASSGIGMAIAQELAVRGYCLVLVSRNQPALKKVAARCEAAGGKCLVVKADVSQRADIERIAAETVKTFGRFDVWINNAGVILYGRFLDIPPEEFDQVLQTNLR